jgi:plastocyanin
VVSCACAVVLGALSACGSNGSSGGAASGSAAPAAGGAAASVITIKDFGFTTPASVAPGAKVGVDNTDSVAHTVTADSGNAFDDQASPGNSSFTAPSTPGTYPFHCNIHPEMHGTLVVK